MSRRSSLVVPLPENASTHRRNRSADDRLSVSNNVAATPAPRRPSIPGTSRSCPIDLSSEKDEDENGDRITPIKQSRQITRIRDDTSKLRPSSAQGPLSQQRPTATRDRPQPHREAASDPGLRSVRQEAFKDTPIAFKLSNRLPCGQKLYSTPEGVWSKKHHAKCQKCQEQQSDQAGTEESQDDEIPILRTPMAASVDHDDINISPGINISPNKNKRDLVDKEGKSKEVRVRTNYGAPLLHHKLLQAAKEDLTTDEKEGYLYVLSSTQHPGLLKLGCSRDVSIRSKQHKARCALAVNEVYISNRVVSMKRAEKLAKIDMAHLQRGLKCSSCSQTHKEWFEVGEEKAKKVAERWIEWINEQIPYTAKGNLDPLWKWLIDYQRAPRPGFAEHDHEARWAHWDSVLPSPSRLDTEKFRGLKKPKPKTQQSDSETASSADEQPAPRTRQMAASRPPLTVPEQASSRALDARQKGNIFNITNNLHLH